MNFGNAIKAGFSNYATFPGRASRSEFWYWVLFACLVTGAGGIIDACITSQREKSGLVGPLISPLRS